jgi:hypothetical protein
MQAQLSAIEQEFESALARVHDLRAKVPLEITSTSNFQNPTSNHSQYPTLNNQ